MNLVNKTADMPGQPDGGDYNNFKINKNHKSQVFTGNKQGQVTNSMAINHFNNNSFIQNNNDDNSDYQSVSLHHEFSLS